MPISREAILQQLKDRGLKVTPQRLAIIDVLVEKGDLHPTASFIYEEAKKRSHRLSLSTTYATLNEFSRRGILRMLQFDRMENRFERNPEEHINLICERCGKIMDYKLPASFDQSEVTHKTGFLVTDSRLEYYGYCGGCLHDKRHGRPS
jgi:Fur family peroxide stress response transcriptional regulator